ncbi:MAG: hypothetical protein WAO98_05390 [Alphaproteobacteria bacterium]
MGTGQGVISHEFVKPWEPSVATARIQELAKSANYDFWYTDDVKAQIKSLGLFTGDVTHVLKHGSVNEEAEMSTQSGVHKYKMVSPTPNSGRPVTVTVAACGGKRQLKVCNVSIDEIF